MPHFNRLIEWLRDSGRQEDLELWFARQPLPPIAFSEVRAVDKPPHNEDIRENMFYLVSSQSRHPKWVLFQCPCGCKTIVTLSLQKPHQPHWKLRKSRDSRPTLYPSVWREAGCLSHFWIQDGRVYWCRHDTGTSPNNAI